eukprot:1138227-Pelagomonas_calceolata.AAC.2
MPRHATLHLVCDGESQRYTARLKLLMPFNLPGACIYLVCFGQVQTSLSVMHTPSVLPSRSIIHLMDRLVEHISDGKAHHTYT